MLGSGALHEPSRSLDCSHGAFLRQNEFLELRTKVRGPSVGCVDDCSGSYYTASSGDSDPAIAVFVRNVQDRSIGLEVQVSLLKELSQECVDELVRPSVEKLRVSKRSLHPVVSESTNFDQETHICPAGCTTAALAPFICENSSASPASSITLQAFTTSFSSP
jgi:hypothetical protein